MATFDEPRTETESAPDAPAEGRLRAPWTKVLGMGLAAFAVWFVLFAPTLQHNAQVSPIGERRTISLDLVGPVAAFSRATQLSRIVSATGREETKPGGTAGLSFSGPPADKTKHKTAPKDRKAHV